MLLVSQETLTSAFVMQLCRVSWSMPLDWCKRYHSTARPPNTCSHVLPSTVGPLKCRAYAAAEFSATRCLIAVTRVGERLQAHDNRSSLSVRPRSPMACDAPSQTFSHTMPYHTMPNHRTQSLSSVSYQSRRKGRSACCSGLIRAGSFSPLWYV